MTLPTQTVDLEAIWDLDDDDADVHAEAQPGRSYCGMDLHPDYSVAADVPVTCAVCADMDGGPWLVIRIEGNRDA